MSTGGVAATQQAGTEGLAIQKANNAVAEATQKAAQDEENRSNMVKSMIGKAKVERF